MNFDSIRELLSPYEGKIPGCALTVVHKGKQVFSHVAGYGDIEREVPVTSLSNFRLASVTKQFTAVGILVLIQQRKISLDNTLPLFFPHFPDYGKNISVYHLLTHSSGLKDYEELMKRNGTQIHDHEILDLLQKQHEGYFLPGTCYRYSNGGYCLLKLIIEKVSGKSFSEFMIKEVFTPLGMQNTYVNEAGLDKISGRVYGYSHKGNSSIQTDQDETSATVGDGGIYSSINDLAKWDRVFYTDIVLLKEFRDMMFEKHILSDEDDASYYGFGLFLKEQEKSNIAYHGGESIGFRTGMCTIPSSELSVFFLSNRREGNGSKMANEIAQIVNNSL